MNKNFVTILATAAFTLATGCVTAGTWVNGCYIDGPLCTVCDGMKVITHAYGTTVCTHCDGTGIEPPEGTVIVENNVIVDTWCPGPVLPPPRYYHHVGGCHREPPHRGGGHHAARPARPKPMARPPATRHTARPAARPAARPTARPATRPAARPAGGGHRPAGGGGRGGGGHGRHR